MPGNLLVTCTGIKAASRSPVTQHWCMSGKCIVSANSIFTRSPSIYPFLLCHGNILTLLDNTIKAGRVLADFDYIFLKSARKCRGPRRRIAGVSKTPGRIALALLCGMPLLMVVVVLFSVVSLFSCVCVFIVRTTNFEGRPVTTHSWQASDIQITYCCQAQQYLIQIHYNVCICILN